MLNKNIQNNNEFQTFVKESHKAIGVLTYRLSKELPQELKEYLPTVAEIEESLEGYLGVK